MSSAQRLSRLGYSLVIVFLFLMVAVPPLSVSPPRDVRAQDENDDICAAHEFHLQGQEWEVGGAILNLPPGQVLNVDLVDIDLLAEQFVDMQFADGTPVLVPDQPVVILIIDDFLTPVKSFTHGEYVRTVASDMVAATSALLGIPDEMIILDTVEVPFDDINAMVTAIDQAMETHLNQGQTQFILNMSFALLPCQYEVTADQWDIGEDVTIEWSQFLETQMSREGNYSLRRYVEETVVVERGIARGIIHDWLSSYAWPLEGSDDDAALDPLRTYLLALYGVLPEDATLVSVASAGNYGAFAASFDYDGDGFVDAFAPASWPEVISVSSTKANYSPAAGHPFTQTSVFTNAGGVAAPGEWYLIAASSERIAGTSFSAPVTSVLAALTQSTSAIACDFEPLGHDDVSNAYFVDAILQTCEAP